MKKSLLFALSALVLTACGTSNPPSQKTDENLLGMWYLMPGNGDGTGTSLFFDEDGIVVYRCVPDITQMVVSDWGGIEKNMTYTIADNNKLCISYSGETYDISPETFEYTTDYTIKEDRLTILNFSMDGYRFEEVSFVAGEEVPKKELNESDKASLDAIFSPNNPYFHSDKVNEYNTSIVLSEEELRAMCPEGVALPEIDFSKECILFSYFLAASSDYNLLGTALYHNPLNDLYEYRIRIRGCFICSDALKEHVAYSVHTIPSNSIHYMTALPLFRLYNPEEQ